jgi:hypothetical protein
MFHFDHRTAYPTDNAWDVPALDPDVQPEAALLPFACWGSLPRTGARKVSWHFYTDDYRFSVLLKNPNQVPDSNPISAVEPNFSVYDQTPAAGVLCATWHKRWLARHWQAQGVPVYVDLNVPNHHQPTNLLGVPKGWRAYATRGYETRIESLQSEWETAVKHSENSRPTLLVFGGGSRVRAFCQESGCFHVPYSGMKNVYSEVANEQG